MKQITRNEVKELNTNNVYAYILSDGEFNLNFSQPNLETDNRFSYSDFDAFIFDHDLKNLAYIILKDESKISGSTALKVVGELTEISYKSLHFQND